MFVLLDINCLARSRKPCTIAGLTLRNSRLECRSLAACIFLSVSVRFVDETSLWQDRAALRSQSWDGLAPNLAEPVNTQRRLCKV